MLNLKGIINVDLGTEINPDSRYVIGSDFTSYSGQNFAKDATVVHITGDESIGGNKTFTNNVRVNGTFTALSTVMIISEVVAFSSNFLTLNNNVTGTPFEDAGIRVNRATLPAAELRWNETTERWTAGITGDLDTIIVAGDLSAAIQNAPNWDSVYTTVLANSAEWSISGNYITSGQLSGYLKHSDFEIYSGQIKIDQHLQDLELTGLRSDVNILSAGVNAISGIFATGDDLEITYDPAGNVYTPVTNNISGHFSGINNYLSNLYNQTSAFLTHTDFESYSGNIAIAQHSQDLAITGKTSLSVYTTGQHTQDLALTGLRSDLDILSAGLVIISGVYMAGDTLDISYIPNASGYTAVANNISGHLSGICSALINRVTLTNYDYIFIGSEPSGGHYPGDRGQRYYNTTSGVIYDCVTTNTWVRYFAAKVW